MTIKLILKIVGVINWMTQSKLKIFDFDNILADEKSYKSILVYGIFWCRLDNIFIT